MSVVTLLICFSFSAFAQTGPTNLNVSGNLYLPSGAPVTQGSVNFRLEIWDKASTCMLYAENHLAQDLSASKGGFDLAVGRGSSPNNYLEGSAVLTTKVFENNGVVAGGWLNCPSGANFVTGDERVIRVSYDLGAGLIAMTPDVPIASSAYAMVADTLQGKRPADLVQVRDDVTYDLSQANVENVFSSTNYARLQQLLSPSTAIGFGSQRLTNVANPSGAQDAATKNYTDTNLAGQPLDLTDVAPGAGNGKVLTWDSTANKWVAMAPSTLGAAGGDLTGSYPNPTIAALAVGTSKISDNAITSAKINNVGVATNRLLITDATTGATVNYAACANNEVLKFVTGTGWTCATVSSLSAVTSVAGKSGAVTLNALDIGGLGTAALYNVGIGSTQIPVLDGGAKLAVSTIPGFSGDITGAYSNAIVAGLQGRSIASTAPNANEVLKWNGSRWEPSLLTDNGITALTGDISAAGNGSVAATLTNGVVTTPKLFTNPGANRLIATDAGSGATLVPFTCNLDEVMQWKSTGWTCVTTASIAGAGMIAHNGNSITAPLVIGTNDSYALNFETNNSPRMTIASDGNVGIGTTNPSRILELSGPMRIQASALPLSPLAGDVAIDVAAGNALKYHNGSAWARVLDQADLGNFRFSTNYLSTTTGNTININSGGPLTSFSAGTSLTLTAGAAGTGASAGGALNLNGGSSPAGNGGAVILTGGQATFTSAAGPVVLVGGTNISTGSAGLISIRGGDKTNGGPAGVASFRGGNSTSTGAGGAVAVNGGNSAGGLGGDVTLSAGTSGVGKGGGVAISATNGGSANNDGGSVVLSAGQASGSGVGGSIQLLGGNVGIGTSTAARLLEVAGAARFAPTTTPASANAGDLFFDTAAANGLKYHNGTAWVSVGNGTGNTTSTGTTNYLPKFSGANSVVNSVIFETSGSVGIGTTSPNRLLQVAGAVRISPTVTPVSAGAGDLFVDSAAGNSLKYYNGSAWVSAGAGDFMADGSVNMTGALKHLAGTAGAPGMTFGGDIDNGIFAPAADNLAFGTSGTERMRILASGNVGIGTTAPARLLNVAGPIRINPASLPASPAAGDLAFDAGAANSLKFHNGSSWQLVGSSNATGDINNGGNAFGASISVGTNDGFGLNLKTANAPRLTIDNSGKVGIGTTSPNRSLEVAGAARFTPTAAPGSPAAGDLYIDSASSNSLKYHNGTNWVSLAVGGTGDFKADGSVAMSGVFRAAAGTANAPSLTFAGNTANGIFAPAGDNLAFATAATERIRILANGNVGIGTTNPSRTLSINGSLFVAPGALPGSAGAGDIAIDAAASNGLKYHNGTAWITLGAGNGDFMASGSVPMAGQLRANAGTFGAPGLAFNGDINTGVFSPSANRIAITTNGSERLRIDGSGNVAIGHTSPLQILDLRRDQDSVTSLLVTNLHTGPSASSQFTMGSSTYSSGLKFYGPGGGNILQLYTLGNGGQIFDVINAAGDFTFRTNYVERFKITNAGLVGIGTTNPNRLLEVAGAARFSPTTAPPSPAPGDIFFDSAASNGLKYHNGSNWVLVGNGTGNTTSTGTANYLSKFNGVNSIVNSVLFESGGNVGIGTTAPTRLLQVAGAMKLSPVAIPGTPAAGDMVIDSGGGNTLKYYNGSAWVSSGAGDFMADGGVAMTGAFRSITGTAGAPGMTFVGDTNTGIYSPVADILAFSTNGTEKARLLANGNLGIGTSTPGLSFEVAAPKGLPATSGTVQTGIVRTKASDGNGVLDYGQVNGGGSWLQATNSADLSANYGILLNPNGGGVGIGMTSNPTTSLQIKTSNTIAGTSVFTSTFYSTSNFSMYTTNPQGSNVGAMIGLGGMRDDAATDAGVFGGIRGAKENSTTANNDGYLGFYTLKHGIAFAERMRIDSNGYVGVGTVTPNRLLEVAGSIRLSPTILPVAPAAGDLAIDSGAANSLKYHNGTAWVSLAGIGSGDIKADGTVPMTGALRSIAGTASAPGLAFVGDTNNGIFAPSADNFAIGTSGTEKLRVLANGNIGIGTTSPNRLLEVTGPIRIAATALPGSAAAGDIAIDSGASNTLKYHNGTNWIALGTGNTASAGSNNYLAKFNASNSIVNSVLYENGGSIGIGTTTPSTLLDVNGTASAGAFRVSTTGPAVSNGLFAPATNSLAFTTNSLERFRVDGSGNVGMGTTTPSEALDVVRASNGGSGIQALNPDSGNSARARIVASNGTNNISVGHTGLNFLGTGSYTSDNGYVLASGANGLSVGANNPTSGDVRIYTHGNTASDERMRITYAGNVGIGTTAPNRLLEVAGPVRFSPAALPGSGAAGDIAIDSGAGNSLKYHNGTSWISLAVGGTGDFKADGSVNMTGTLKHLQGTAGAPGITFAGDTDNGIFAPVADNLAFTTSATERMRILANGNVGIGTTSASSPLTVTSTATQSAAGYYYNQFSMLDVSPTSTSSANTYAGLFARAGTSSSNLGAASMVGAEVSAHVYNGTGTLPFIGGITAAASNYSSRNITTAAAIDAYTSTENTGSMTNAIGLQVRVFQNGGPIANGYGVLIPAVQGANRWSLYASDASAPSFFAANVGIGTTAPLRKLEVSGPIRISPSALPGSPGAGDLALDSGASNLLKYHNGSTWITVAAGGGAVWQLNSPNAYYTAGNVGIGTSSPTHTLHVVGSSTVQKAVGAVPGSNLDTNQFASFANIDRAGEPRIFAVTTSPTNDAVLRSFNANILLQGGNVGIGTTSPSTALHVAGSVRMVDGNQAAGKVMTSDASGVASWQTPGIGNPVNTQTFNSNGTWTKPASGSMVLIECWGGGEGGGGSWNGFGPVKYGGQGGAGGSYAQGLFPLSALSATEAVTVGVGGLGDANATGGLPGTSSKVFRVRASGGAEIFSGSEVGIIGGAGGTDASGTTTPAGIPESPACAGGGGGGGGVNGTAATASSGATNSCGGTGGAGSITGTGGSGTAPGGGGGGAAHNSGLFLGGNGAAGRCILRTY